MLKPSFEEFGIIWELFVFGCTQKGRKNKENKKEKKGRKKSLFMSIYRNKRS